MIKWYDEIQKQIDEIQAEIEGIEVGEVDAKNLSEVLDKDAPIKLTTDLQNNKVKVGLDIDSETLEVDNGKLKVKAGGSGAKKYLHTIEIHNGTAPFYHYIVKIISESNVAVNNTSTFTAFLNTITPTEIHNFGSANYLCVTPILSPTNKVDTSGQLITPLWIIKAGDNLYGKVYSTLKLDGSANIDYYFENGILLHNTTPYPTNAVIKDIVTEL